MSGFAFAQAGPYIFLMGKLHWCRHQPQDYYVVVVLYLSEEAEVCAFAEIHNRYI